MFSDTTITHSENGRTSIKTVERRAFVEWISRPAAEREPKSLKAWAAQNGVAYATVKLWKNDTRVYAEAAERLGRHIDLDSIPGIIENMARMAETKQTTASVAAARLVIDYLKWHVDRTKDDATDVSKLSDAELRELMVDALDELDVRAPLPDIPLSKKARDLAGYG